MRKRDGDDGIYDIFEGRVDNNDRIDTKKNRNNYSNETNSSHIQYKVHTPSLINHKVEHTTYFISFLLLFGKK